MMKSLALALSLLVYQHAHAQLSDNAPPDKPLFMESNDAQASFKKRIAPLTIQARNTWVNAKDRYFKNPATMLFVSVTLVDESQRQETVFVQVKSIAKNMISGNISSNIEFVSGYRIGDRIKVDESTIVDWTISNPDGTEDGNLIGKLIDSLQLSVHSK